MNTALVVVDMQNDFMPGGALGVPGADRLGPAIKRMAEACDFVVATADWHPPNHCSFTEQGGIWPQHCVAGTHGAAIHPSVRLEWLDLIIRKAEDPEQDAYSGFQNTLLEMALRNHGVNWVHVVGVATDYCVKATALDALKAGFETTVYTEACAAVNANPSDGSLALTEMRKAGVSVV